MNETEFDRKIADLSSKVEAVYVSVEKTRKYFLILMVVSVIAFVLPLLGLLFAIPSFLSSYSAALNF